MSGDSERELPAMKIERQGRQTPMDKLRAYLEENIDLNQKWKEAQEIFVLVGDTGELMVKKGMDEEKVKDFGRKVAGSDDMIPRIFEGAGIPSPESKKQAAMMAAGLYLLATRKEESGGEDLFGGIPAVQEEEVRPHHKEKEGVWYEGEEEDIRLVLKGKKSAEKRNKTKERSDAIKKLRDAGVDMDYLLNRDLNFETQKEVIRQRRNELFDLVEAIKKDRLTEKQRELAKRIKLKVSEIASPNEPPESPEETPPQAPVPERRNGEKTKITKECYAELAKIYDSGRNMVNMFNMGLYEDSLTKALEKLEKIDSGLAEQLRDEFLTVGILHDLRLMVNTKGAVDDQMLKYAAELKGKQFDTLIHLQDRLESDTDGDYVARYLAAIDRKARDTYTGDGHKVFKLEDLSLEGELVREVGGGRLFYQIARDLYRVTGGEARYGVAGNCIQDWSKGGSYGIESNSDKNNGAFLRTAMNMRRACAGAVDPADGGYALRYRPQLWAHLDPGVASFWENLWKQASEKDSATFIFQNEIRLTADVTAGIPPRKYAILSLEALRKLRLGIEEEGSVCLGNEIAFNTWMETEGKVASMMLKEFEFMGSPTFRKFRSTIVEGYFPILLRERDGGRKINRDQYLIERLGDLVDYYIAADKALASRVRLELEEFRSEAILFKSDPAYFNFLQEHNIPTKDIDAVRTDLSQAAKRLIGASGPRAQKDTAKIIGSMIINLLKEGFKDATK